MASYLLALICLATFLVAAMSHGDEEEMSGMSSPKPRQKLLFISLDGFYYKYLSTVLKVNSNNFSLLAENGVFAEHGIQGVFLTKTLPSHYSMLTGLYEESHGIVATQFVDPETNRTVDIAANSANHTYARYFRGEPIFVSLARAPGRSINEFGCSMFFGCELGIGNVTLPNLVPFEYTSKVPFERRVDTVIDDWFLQKNVNLALLYYSHPDTVAHWSGTFGPETNKSVLALNDGIGYLIKKLKESHLWDSLNIIITGDHGMTDLKIPSLVSIPRDDKLFSISFLDDVMLQVRPLPGMESATLTHLNNHIGAEKHAQVFLRAEMPESWHYKKSDRVAPIVVVASEGYSLIVPNGNALEAHSVTTGGKATHGYNNSLDSMRPLFVAHGPAFRKNAVVPPMFSLVDLYTLMAFILEIPSAPNNGSIERVLHLLREDLIVRLESAGLLHDSNEWFHVSQGVLVILLCSASVVCFASVMFACHRASWRRGHVYWALRRPYRPTAQNEESGGQDDEEEEDDFLETSERVQLNGGNRKGSAPKRPLLSSDLVRPV